MPQRLVANWGATAISRWNIFAYEGPAPLVWWLVAGALVGLGAVGYLTGLIIAFLGLILAAVLLACSVPGAWFFLVGAGAGAAALTLDDVLRYGDGSCRQADPPHPFLECPAPGIPEIFWVGVAVAFLGLAGAAVTRMRMSDQVDQRS